MGSCCRDSSSSPRRHRYVSWCVDSAEPPTPEATGTPEEGSGSVPHLILTPPDPIRRLSHQPPPTALTKRTHQEAFTHVDEGPDGHPADEGRKGTNEDRSLQHPEDETFLLPRSSPVIHRRHRPVSWTGGATDTSGPSSTSSPESPSPTSGSLDQRSGLRGSASEDLGSKRSSCLHSSSNLSTRPQRPLRGQQGLAEEQSGRGLTGCHSNHSSGLSSSSHISREKRISGIPEFSADIFKTSCELEKENAHFIVVDMVLEVLEGVKWTLTMDTHRHTHCQTCTHTHMSCAEAEPSHEQTQSCKVRHREQHRHPDEDEETSRRNTHSFQEHTHQHTQEEEEAVTEAPHQPKTFSVLSTDSGFEDGGVDSTLTPTDSLRDAEVLAQQLVLEFRRSWLPSHGPRRGRLSLRSSLQELPGTAGVVSVSRSSLEEEIRLRTRMRGSLSWAPPRLQIIFTVQPSHRRSDVVALQHFLCAGCGTEVDHKFIKKLRYCEYLGRYFCDCCHGGADAVIPARVLSSWDFSRCPVSDFSKQLLDSVWFQPLFDLSCVGKTLYSRVKELDRFRELQDQLLGIKKLLRACRLSGRVLTEFEQLPAHLTEQPHLFSMDDLLRVKKGQLVVQARAVLQSAIQHVENCQLCLARGFICEFCREKDVIFPFQTDVCRRCPVCRACFHKHCFVEKKCPKCARIQSRKKRLDRSMK
uniref:protein associated with UVRAG as autophagy enhancer-like isoform X2 n=1 Tax=Semicossyphus pulcher TaxID=241346 RepID=UPI0037E988C3